MTESFYVKKISVRWADLDPNFHLRHSVYYDFGAQLRIEFLFAHGLTPEVMRQQHLGPVIFREECIFRREIKLADEVYITAKLARLNADASRWTMRHEFLSAAQKILATITVDGAWIDTDLRKLAVPVPGIVKEVFDKIPHTEDFEG